MMIGDEHSMTRFQSCHAATKLSIWHKTRNGTVIKIMIMGINYQSTIRQRANQQTKLAENDKGEMKGEEESLEGRLFRPLTDPRHKELVDFVMLHVHLDSLPKTRMRLQQAVNFSRQGSA
ncbi:PREDICTED: uncharacterized protein LOC105567914 [Vollenhovia emeryi]|uniref:uncharacterized protein LOC105567914 n=1 Tax=Vollenhovia emeryi TaxID=411798 RepID=UPI0005F53539|nr:PREDICTED: uncharacterized protein LOC105567914 [Vollenhovia emeryi]